MKICYLYRWKGHCCSGNLWKLHLWNDFTSISLVNFTDTNFPLFWKIFHLFVSLIYEIFFNKFEINLVSLHGHVVSSIFLITYSVIQRFPALRKAITTHMKKYGFFSCVSAADWQYQTHLKKNRIFSSVWYSQSAADTSLAFHITRSGWSKTAEPPLFSIHGCLTEFFLEHGY